MKSGDFSVPAFLNSQKCIIFLDSIFLISIPKKASEKASLFNLLHRKPFLFIIVIIIERKPTILINML